MAATFLVLCAQFHAMHFVVDGFFLCASRVTDARIAAQKRDNIKQKGGKKTTEAAEEPQTDAAAAV